VLFTGTRVRLTFWTINRVWRLEVKGRIDYEDDDDDDDKKNGPYGVIACAKLAMLPKNEMLTSHAQDK